jgi:hypothetical protein
MKLTTDTVSGAAVKTSISEPNTKCTEQRGLRDVEKGEKQAGDAARGARGKTSTRERNQRCSERRVAQVLDKRKNPTMQ